MAAVAGFSPRGSPACVDEALEAERVALCGARYEHAVDRKAMRGGHAGSSLVLGGRRVTVNRENVPSGLSLAIVAMGSLPLAAAGRDSVDPSFRGTRRTGGRRSE